MNDEKLTATERLRQLLDERGVEWRNRPYIKESITTIWKACGTEYHYRESRYGQTRLHADDLTPEQAVEATLGRGTCRMCKRKGYDREHLHHYECSECGEEVLRSSVMGESEPPRFCPECGRRVEP